MNGVHVWSTAGAGATAAAAAGPACVAAAIFSLWAAILWKMCSFSELCCCCCCIWSKCSFAAALVAAHVEDDDEEVAAAAATGAEVAAPTSLKQVVSLLLLQVRCSWRSCCCCFWLMYARILGWWFKELAAPAVPDEDARLAVASSSCMQAVALRSSRLGWNPPASWSSTRLWLSWWRDGYDVQ